MLLMDLPDVLVGPMLDFVSITFGEGSVVGSTNKT